MKKIVFICTVFVFFVSPLMFGQSRYLEDGIGGPGFSINAGINNYKFTTIGMAAGYSIGGIMDFGVMLNREEGELYSSESTDIDFGFIYNLIVVKQTENVPFNVQLEGNYGYTNVNSEYLDVNMSQRTGQGFSLGLSVFSELKLIPHFDLQVGIKGLYSNYLFTQTDTTVPSVPVISSLERTESLKAGVLGAVSINLDNWPVMAIGADLLYSIMEPGVSVVPSVSIISRMH